MYRVLVILSLLFFTNCKSGKAVVEEKENITQNETEINMAEPYYTQGLIGEYEDSAPVDIDSAYIKGNQLFLNVRYAGGCGEHDFHFIGSSVIIKTNPPKRTVKLVHVTPADTCMETIHRQVIVDLRELAHEKETGKEIVLILSRYKEQIHYIYE